MLKRKVYWLVNLCLVIAMVSPVLAADNKLEDYWEAGPKVVKVGSDLATIDLPEDYAFTGADYTKKIMQKMGNPITDEEVGIVIPKDEKQNWFILLEFQPVGYVKDEEGDKLDAQAILDSIKQGNEEANKERSKQGGDALHIIGWQEPPHYDKVTHNLEWALLAEGEKDKDKVINANTRLLGRGGVVSVTLVGTPDEVALAKPHLDEIIGQFHYNKGKQYSDFTPGQDKVAEFGLTALMAGGLGAAAVKTGFFAKFILPLLLVLKKFLVVILAVIAGLFSKVKNFFTGNKSKDEP
jgi:uncharacterized membrane-anchored protein